MSIRWLHLSALTIKRAKVVKSSLLNILSKIGFEEAFTASYVTPRLLFFISTPSVKVELYTRVPDWLQACHHPEIYS
jgi:hypothetical protein